MYVGGLPLRHDRYVHHDFADGGGDSVGHGDVAVAGAVDAGICVLPLAYTYGDFRQLHSSYCSASDLDCTSRTDSKSFEIQATSREKEFRCKMDARCLRAMRCD